MISEDRDIVCPACEHRFPATGVADGQLRPCPACHYSFLWIARPAAPVAQRPDPWQDLLDRLPLPHIVAEHAAMQRLSLRPGIPRADHIPPSTTAPPIRQTSRSQPEVNQPPAPIEPSESTTHSHVESLDPRIALPASPFASPLVRLAALAAILAMVVIAIALTQRFGSQESTGDYAARTPSRSSTFSDPAAPSTPVGEKTDRTSTEPGDHEVEALEWPLFHLGVSPDELWRQIGGYVVSVEHRLPAGTVTTAGWLVDTRGWVVAPLLNDATSVRIVRAAPSTDPIGPASSGPVLPSRGVNQPSSDLGIILLQVDNTDSSTFTDPLLTNAIAPTPPAPPTVVAGPHSDDLWLQVLEALPEATGESRQSDGVVANLAGEMLGMLVAQAAGPPRWHSAAEISAELTKIAPATFPPRREAPTPAPAPDSVATTAPSDQTLRSLPTLRDLHVRLIALEASARIERFPQFLELAHQVHQIELLEDDPTTSEATRTALSEGAAAIRSDWQKTPWPEPALVTTWNEQMAKQVVPGQGFWGYAQVESVPPLSPRVGSQDLIILKLMGTEFRVGIPVSLAFDAFTPGSRWMIWGTVSSNSWIDAGSRHPLIDSRYLIEEPEVLFETP